MKLALPQLKSYFFAYTSVLSLLILYTLSCKKDNGEIYEANKQEAKMRIINASQKSTSIDLFVNDMKLNPQSIPFGESIDYVKVASGEKKAVVSHDNGEQVSANIKFLPTFSYTTFFIENKIEGKELLTIEDNHGSIEEGKAKLRFVNTSPYFTNNINVTLTGGYLLVNALQFKETSAYFQIDPNVNIRLNIVGTGVSKTIPTEEIEAGKSYTFWISGASNSDLTVNKIIYN